MWGTTLWALTKHAPTHRVDLLHEAAAHAGGIKSGKLVLRVDYHTQKGQAKKRQKERSKFPSMIKHEGMLGMHHRRTASNHAQPRCGETGTLARRARRPGGSAIPQAPGTNDSWTLRAPFQRSTKHQAAGISWVAGGGMSTSEATEKSINR